MGGAAAREPFIIASGIPTSFNEQVSLVLRVWGSDLKPERRTATRLRSAGATAERFSGEKAKAILGWGPEVSVAEGVARVAGERRRHGNAV
jgi:UDP-glucose 4-epimerase